jgi:hypothetical protein
MLWLDTTSKRHVKDTLIFSYDGSYQFKNVSYFFAENGGAYLL